MIDLEKISGIGEYKIEKLACEQKRNENDKRIVYKVGEHAFLVQNKNTFEVRTDEKLKKVLVEKYETVMESRYFGRGGIEVVNSGQLKNDEVEDLIRLSYNLTKEII